jgi:hypothetical protein
MIGRSLLIVGWVTVMWFGIHAAPVTRLVFAPQTMEIVGGEVHLVRRFPGDTLGLPRPSLSYVEVVRPLTPTHNAGQSCQDEGGPFPYTRATPVGVWNITAWAADCLSDPVGVEWYARWTWHVGDLRLGPVKRRQVVIAEKI